MSPVRLHGTMTCPPEAAPSVRRALPEHIRLTRQEPGCLSFEVTETQPGLFTVEELFADRAAFDAHQSRMRSSAWFHVTANCPRQYQVTEE